MNNIITRKTSASEQNANHIHVNRTKNNSFISSLHNGAVNLTQFILSVLFLTLFLSSTANAHRGAKGEVDTCRFSVGKEVVHFSAYTPSSSGGQSYCHAIPYIELTDLVIDYEGKNLRNTTVEFEVTKEPEGTRILYQAPEKFKKGSVDFKIDFAQYGAGDYLTHVTIVSNGETVDAHLPFSVGVDPENSGIPYKIIIPFILVIIILITMKMMSIKRDDQQDL